jgi:diguanylate cyclase
MAIEVNPCKHGTLMADNISKPGTQNPADIAREAFRRLAIRRITPTPDAYREIYDEIAGIPAQPNPETLLTRFATRIAELPGEVGDLGVLFNRALSARDWQDYHRNLQQLIDRHLHTVNAIQISPAPAPASAPASKPLPMHALDASNEAQLRLLRDMLGRTLSFAVASLLQGAPELAEESEKLSASLKTATSEEALNDVNARLKQLCFKIELKSGELAEQHELLLRLFKLLLENIRELLEDDTWLSGQISGVQNLLSGPISHNALKDATRSLKEVIYKQGVLRHSLTDAKTAMKNLMITFMDRLSDVAASTGDYHQKIDNYSHQISSAKDIGELNKILDDIMRDTKITQAEALKSRDEMITARHQVQGAEARIHDLEKQLEQMSELVREDQLTGSLNRRGLDDVFEREAARSERRQSPLCVAMLDLDDFKRLNDTYGHSAGDGALIHVVRVIKDTLRTMDVIGRFGGEEFMVILPDTPLEDAKQTIKRLQRELTKRIFMYNHEKLLITFSAGVAMRTPGEDQASLIKRADDALYKAKRNGKNRVAVAE